MGKTIRAFFSALLIASLFLFSGCGRIIGSGEEGYEGPAPLPGPQTDITSASALGFTECYKCHSDAATPSGLSAVFGDSDASKSSESGWLNGPHGNYETSVNHQIVDYGPDNTGFPDYNYFSDDTCKTCHDQIEDGKKIADFASKTSINKIGRVNRPVIGCESCHGSGNLHLGGSAITYAKPDAGRCGQCHSASFPDSHLKYHPEGDNVYEEYATSPHSTSINSHNYVTGSTTDVRATCSKCHTDEGAVLYKDVSGGHDELAASMTGKADIKFANAVQCRTCHDPHNPDKLLKPATTGASAEYNTCTNCHQLSDGYHGEKSAYSWGPQGYPAQVGIGNLDPAEVIYDTHFDNATTTWIEGYVIDASSDRACRDCHNVHGAGLTINKQWAKSAHGGDILETKEAAFLNTSNASDPSAEANEILYGTSSSYGDVTDNEGPAWAHYNFKTQYGGSCSRCHTSTGFKNLAADPTKYAASNNVFFATGNQKEMLYCWACHKDNKGGLRDPGLFVNSSPYANPAGRIANVPDVSGSNICISCHSGRETGGNIKAKSSSGFTNTSFVNSHYLVAGGVLFRTIGYEYGSLNYDDYVYFVHNRIGTGTVSGGSNGPCVGCHMKGSEGHTFKPIANATGPIDDITSYDGTCSKCHFSGESTLINSLNTLKSGYSAALEALKTLLLSKKGYAFYPAHPYFYNAAGYDPAYTESGSCSKNLAVKNWLTGGSNNFIWNGTSCVFDYQNDGTPDTGKDNMGAAFNYGLLYHEPGAYVHNLTYTRRLIYDTIDHIDNDALDDSVSATLSGNTAALGFIGTTRP